MSLDYPQLAALAAVVAEGSFEAAARALHVTPSAVSQRVKLLEQRLGAVLVVRGQPCRPTPPGLQLCRHAERVALLEHELRAALPLPLPHGAARERAGPIAWASLRVAANADSLATWFIDAMARFAEGETGVQLDVVLDDQDHTADALRSGQALAAVTSMAEPVPGCSVQALGKLRYLATASPAFMKRHFAQGVDAASLECAPSLVFNAKDRLQERWLRRMTRRSVRPPQHRLPASQAFVDACLAGLGWGMNPQALVEPHLRSGRLVELVAGRSVDIALYWQASRLALPPLERLTVAVRAAARRALY